MTKILLNGEWQTVEAENLEHLLLVLNIIKGKVAIERNLEIVPRSAYGETLLCEGDRIEIVHFVGGG